MPRYPIPLHQPTQGTSLARVVLVGGIDPGTGAGLARDLLTATSLGARGFLVGTAWTEQGPQSTRTIEPRAPERVQAALTSALARVAGTQSAVKIGMVATAPIAQAIAIALSATPVPTVYDPVLRASSSDALYDGDRSSVLALARAVALLTPNLSEAAWLLDRPVRSESEARVAARELRALGVAAVLVKGGHLEGDATDVLVSPAGESVFSSPRVPGPSPRGTGCALATAIAVGLARGEPLERAVATAKTWLTEHIARARDVGGEWHL
jgi:hydroxymethylpyrimidine/phosphomethylpyrimidine kinase